ncbi:T9SS type A sorting domain-containing protein [Balneolales bacterium ANBcel1]|nr:T9SS type A sorting domain-containing protein [Balneolales bacterium ANBcel1]
MKQWIPITMIMLLTPVLLKAQFTDGDGSEANPYQVATLEQLQAIGEQEYLDKHFIQTADIDASETADWNGGEGFEPIGRLNSSRFEGFFDGQGFVITGLYIQRNDSSQVGLFGAAGGATITNTHLRDVEITGHRNVGGLIGFLGQHQLPQAEVHDVSVTGMVTGENNVGGLMGYSSAIVIRAHAAVNVEGYNYVGGLMGTNGGLTEKSYATGQVTGNDQVGGLAGDNLGTIEKSYATGDVQGSENVGGLSGRSNHTLQAVYATGNVIGKNRVGGLLGYNSLPVVPAGSSWVLEAYALGEVSGEENTAGLIGDNSSILDLSYWNTETSSQSEGVGPNSANPALPFQGGDIRHNARGLLTADMTGEQAYIHMFELDFDETWQLTEGYPVFQWQKPNDTVEAPDAAILRFPRKYINFLGEDVGKSRTRTLPIENSGTIPIQIEVSVSGDGFELRDGGESVMLAPQSEDVIHVIFRPESANIHEGTLYVEHDAPNIDSPVEIYMRGSGHEPTTAEQVSSLPDQPILHQNYPNPFNSTTVIRYDLLEGRQVSLVVYDVMGRRVATLIDRTMPAGSHTAHFDASDLASGIYIYRLTTPEFSKTRQMTVVK